jgi:hypothetical protein
MPPFYQIAANRSTTQRNPFVVTLFDKCGAQRAYAKHALMKIPSLDDWEKEWGKNSQRNVQPKLLPVDFRLPLMPIEQHN